MGFSQTFDTFNPISDEVPCYPFYFLPDIAWRARTLLETRTSDEIINIALALYWQFDEYFQELKKMKSSDYAIRIAWI